MVAGHHEMHPGQRFEELARLGELGRPGMLDKVPGNYHEVRREFLDDLDEGRYGHQMSVAEVQVGEVNQGAHNGLTEPLRFRNRHALLMSRYPDAECTTTHVRLHGRGHTSHLTIGSNPEVTMRSFEAQSRRTERL